MLELAALDPAVAAAVAAAALTVRTTNIAAMVRVGLVIAVLGVVGEGGLGAAMRGVGVGEGGAAWKRSKKDTNEKE